MPTEVQKFPLYLVPVSITLEFSGQEVDPDLITKVLETQPDSFLRAGEYKKLWSGQEVISEKGVWELSRISITEDDFDFGEYKEWCNFLTSEKQGLLQLYEMGCWGKLNINLNPGI